MPPVHDKIAYIEIPAIDIERSAAFVHLEMKAQV